MAPPMSCRGQNLALRAVSGAGEGCEGTYLAAVLKGEPQGEVAAALGMLGVGEDDGALGGPVQPRTNTADGGPENHKPPSRKRR